MKEKEQLTAVKAKYVAATDKKEKAELKEQVRTAKAKVNQIKKEQKKK